MNISTKNTECSLIYSSPQYAIFQVFVKPDVFIAHFAKQMNSLAEQEKYRAKGFRPGKAPDELGGIRAARFYEEVQKDLGDYFCQEALHAIFQVPAYKVYERYISTTPKIEDYVFSTEIILCRENVSLEAFQQEISAKILAYYQFLAAKIEAKKTKETKSEEK